MRPDFSGLGVLNKFYESFDSSNIVRLRQSMIVVPAGANTAKPSISNKDFLYRRVSDV